MVISFVTALTLMLAFIFGSPNVKRYKRDGLSFEESRFYCLHCTYCYISAKLHPLGLSRLVNECESLINVVSSDQRKRLSRLNQNGKGSGTGALTSPVADVAPPAEKRDLTDSVVFIERGKPVILPNGNALRKASRSGCG